MLYKTFSLAIVEGEYGDTHWIFTVQDQVIDKTYYENRFWVVVA